GLTLEREGELDLAPDTIDPAGDDVLRVEHTLGTSTAWVTDEARGPAYDDDRPMSRELEPSHGGQLHEVPELKARRGGIKAAVERDRLPVEQGAQRLSVRRMGDQAPPQEILEHRSGHGRTSIPAQCLLPCRPDEPNPATAQRRPTVRWTPARRTDGTSPCTPVAARRPARHRAWDIRLAGR